LWNLKITNSVRSRDKSQDTQQTPFKAYLSVSKLMTNYKNSAFIGSKSFHPSAPLPPISLQALNTSTLRAVIVTRVVGAGVVVVVVGVAVSSPGKIVPLQIVRS
jgi:hypothetical protein